MCKPKQTNSIFLEVVLDAFYQKKNSTETKVAKYWSKTTICFDKQNSG